MPEDPDAIDVDVLVTRGELLDAGLLVGERIVAKVVVAVAMIRQRALWTAAAIADLDDDHAKLRELLRNATGIEGEVHRLRLWPRVDVGDDGI